MRIPSPASSAVCRISISATTACRRVPSRVASRSVFRLCPAAATATTSLRDPTSSKPAPSSKSLSLHYQTRGFQSQSRKNQYQNQDPDTGTMSSARTFFDFEPKDSMSLPLIPSHPIPAAPRTSILEHLYTVISTTHSS